MIVHYSIRRYGTYEYRTIDISLEEVVREEAKSLISSCAGFEEGAIDSIEVEYSDTGKQFIKDYL